MNTRAATPIVGLTGFSKTFANRRVLKDVSLDLNGGEVHALVGQNGSGKSTLIKILSGYHHPDPGGRLEVRGGEVSLPLYPSQPRELGLTFVHQDLGLVGPMTVLENLRVGRYETRAGWRVPWRRERRIVREALRRFGSSIDPDRTVDSLREVDRAIVAIVRAIEEVGAFSKGLLVLDEPTVYLPRDGVEHLFAAVRHVTASGHAVLLVTHRLDEVLEHAARVSVLRDGALVSSGRVTDISKRELVAQILGRDMGELYPESHNYPGTVVLSVEGLQGDGIRDVSFDLREGEILGITGLLGMGFEQVPRALFGAAAVTGSIWVRGKRHELASSSPRAAMRQGLALVPADRAREGAVLDASLRENLTLPVLGRYFARGRLRHRRELRDTRARIEEFDIRPPHPDRKLSRLSGGNQQKLLLAKWFEHLPRVLILHEPTQGVDIGARQQIFQKIADAAEAGVAVIVASVEYADLAQLCNRVLVFRDGVITTELVGESLTEARIIERCFVASERHADVGSPAPT